MFALSDKELMNILNSTLLDISNTLRIFPQNEYGVLSINF